MNYPGSVLFILPPQTNTSFRSAVGYALYCGLDVAYADGDVLPTEAPSVEDLGRYDAVVVQYADMPRLRDSFKCFEGVEETSWDGPEPSVWHGGTFKHRQAATKLHVRTASQLARPGTIEAVVFDLALEQPCERAVRRLKARATPWLHEQAYQRCLTWKRCDWSDVMAQFAKDLLWASEVTGDNRGIDHARTLYDGAYERIPEGQILGKYQIPDSPSPTQPWPLTTLTYLTRVRPSPRDDRFIRSHWPAQLETVPSLARPQRWSTGIVKKALPILAVAAYCDDLDKAVDALGDLVLEHETRCRDARTGLPHYWNMAGKTPDHVCGHGADLYMLHVSQFLHLIPKEHRCYEPLLKNYQGFAAALAEYQQPSGAWNHMLDVPTSLPSTGYTCVITQSLFRGVRLGLLPRERLDAARRGWDFLKTRTFQGGWYGLACGLTASANTEYLSAHIPTSYDYHSYPPIFVLGAANEALRDLGAHHASQTDRHSADHAKRPVLR